MQHANSGLGKVHIDRYIYICYCEQLSQRFATKCIWRSWVCLPRSWFKMSTQHDGTYTIKQIIYCAAELSILKAQQQQLVANYAFIPKKKAFYSRMLFFFVIISKNIQQKKTEIKTLKIQLGSNSSTLSSELYSRYDGFLFLETRRSSFYFIKQTRAISIYKFIANNVRVCVCVWLISHAISCQFLYMRDKQTFPLRLRSAKLLSQ